MKRIQLLTTLCFFVLQSYAQRGANSGNPKIKAYKIAFITEKLNLSESEAAKFWPIYNQYEKTKFSLHKREKKEIRNKVKAAGGIDYISKDEAQRFLVTMRDIRKAQYDNKTTFHNNIVEILPAKKVLLLEITEHEFNKRLMERLKKRRNNRIKNGRR
ncbi:hypothetical protein [Tenacibaculum sp. SZ-18]|uniref:hypothetical protein n=1 Tax=Tenacibaculum sp. SZ-18 TaxID=754423 RepID=UPI0012FDBEB0|nr:hypothetical protein [Tenacibaculum sp. SZ-18]